jgi:hypothetical protein
MLVVIMKQGRGKFDEIHCVLLRSSRKLGFQKMYLGHCCSYDLTGNSISQKISFRIAHTFFHLLNFSSFEFVTSRIVTSRRFLASSHVSFKESSVVQRLATNISLEGRHSRVARIVGTVST